ncbi:glycosyltransferase family 2 protein [Porphyromonas sp.]|uniref:glycosyltransferase family 2 protein n=1 Tax=Porphyromonas sp. TaxID=1924944 RepID=UPI0026DD8C6E|nr:glycosyltransferase family 2 protein [Porphyromonas sp.]MDO4770800.1 glycosyltransferase family 2 protein [Porphyromonas sp.]
MNTQEHTDSLDLSIVIPLYNEEESLHELYAWIRRVVDRENLSTEVIFVDDGSTDASWKVIEELAEANDNVRGIRFSRNYGKSPALQTGFGEVQGRVIITMDADLQDSPDEIPELYRMIAEEGYDLVSGWKRKRYDPLSKTLPTKLFNATVRRFSGIRLHDFNCGLKAYRREVTQNIEVYNDMHRFMPYMAKLAGFGRIGEKVVEHRARKFGTTKFGMDRFVNGYLDLLVLWFTGRFGRKPMHFFGLWGSVMFFVSFIALCILLIDKFVALQNGRPAPLVASTPYFYFCLVGILLGVQMFLAGFIGELISRQSPSRNHYTIRKKI